MKLALGMLVMAPFCLADQTAYSDFCRTADIDNGIPNIYCFAGQQLFNDAPRPFPNTLPLSGQLVSVTLKLAWSASSVDGASDNQPHALGIGSVFYRKRGASMYCYFGTQTLLADGGWHDVTFDTASAIDPNTSTHTSNCDLDFATETLDYIELNHGGVVGAWTDTNIYTDGISQQANTCGGNCISPNHSLWYKVGLMLPSPPETWSLRLSSTATPGARLQSAMAYDPMRAQILLFGGNNQSGQGSGELNDTWAWNGGTWVQLSPAFVPPAMQGHAMATNASGDGVIMLAPQLGGSGDVFWIWDGSNWTQQNVPAPLLGRAGYAIAFDEVRNQVVFFGGSTCNGCFFNDTWVWNGTTWIQKFPTTSPQSRVGHGMSFDSVHGQVLLFGGSDASGKTLNDTWTWDGNNWVQKLPANAPTPRFIPTMADDPLNSGVLLFGGSTSDQLLNDTWTWDGNTWTGLPASQPQPLGGYTSLTHDEARGQIVLFNRVCCFGTSNSQVASGTWTWGQATTTEMITVVTNLSSATFTIVGPASYSGGGYTFNQSDAPLGSYNITFGAVPGYTTPSAQHFLLTGAGANIVANYVATSGTLSITTDVLGGAISITGPAALQGQGPHVTAAVPIGSYIIAFAPISGYLTPSTQSVQVAAGATATVLGHYAPAPAPGSISVQLRPSGASRAGYSIVGPSNFEGVGTHVYGSLPPGKYTITFKPLVGPGLITPPPQTQTLISGQQLSFIGAYSSIVTPLTLTTSYDTIGTYPLYVGKTYTSTSLSNLTATLSIANNLQTWYELDIDFAALPTPQLPSSKTNFVLGPGPSQVTIPMVVFANGYTLRFTYSRTSPAALIMLAIDMICRGVFGQPFPSDFLGSLDLAAAGLQALLTTDQAGLVGQAAALRLCNGNLVCIANDLTSMFASIVTNQQTLNAIAPIVTQVFGPNAVGILGATTVQHFLKNVTEALALPANALQLYELTRGSIDAPLSGFIQLTAHH